MKSSLQKLYKFFKLEAEHGFDNRAVIGGLDRMLAPWEPEARLENIPEEWIQAVMTRLRDYAHLSPTSRAESLGGLWKRIQHESTESLPDLPSANLIGEVTEGKGEPDQSKTRPDLHKKSHSPAPTAELHHPGQQPRYRKQLAPPIPEGSSTALNAPLTVLTGVGPRHASTLARLGLHTLGDTLYYFPRRYDDYSKLKPIRQLWYGEVVTVIGVVQSVTTRTIRGGRTQFVEAVVSDGSSALRITWWNPYIAKRVHAGMQVALSGKVEQYLGRLVMVNPEVEELDQQNLSTNRIVPVYSLTANITQRWLRRLMFQVINYWAPRVQDTLPESTRHAAGLMTLPEALQQVHFPSSAEQLKAAQQRLAFDEIFLLQLGVLRQKRAWQDRTARTFEIPDDWLSAQVASLPFPLTGAQQRTLADLRADLLMGRPMNRLLQGDVGSGKTVIAALGIAMIAKHGAQSAIMAPTSILAEQHYRNLLRLLDSVLPQEAIRLMIGATPESEKRDIRNGLESGEIKLVVGTHALIEDPVSFADLQLVVIDEQHRFGVEQRAALRAKGRNPHLLVMTATPIPRSLALTIYGDLDLSVMDEMPPGRQPIGTYIRYPREREGVYTKVRSEIEQGHQTFIIYPLVEESENRDRGNQNLGDDENKIGRSAVEEYARLQKEIFPKYKLGLLHGRMKADEKDAVMADFRDGKIHILVSTSVVEVGVDITNATLMIIEGADRFGLAQLHQFRGRVGRGSAKSYCILIPETPDDAENERLKAMTETNDGFVLAERDLEQRGPGDFLGTRQAGISELRMASLTDVHLIEKARHHAQELFGQDADLQQPQHALLSVALRRFWEGEKSDLS